MGQHIQSLGCTCCGNHVLTGRRGGEGRGGEGREGEGRGGEGGEGRGGVKERGRRGEERGRRGEEREEEMRINRKYMYM